MKKYMIKVNNDPKEIRRLTDEYALFDCNVKKSGNYIIVERNLTEKQKEQRKPKEKKRQFKDDDYE